MTVEVPVTRCDRAVVAIHGATCAVTSGARIAVTGPSGSGKSTLVHLLGGLEQPTAGTVEWPALVGGGHRRAAQIGMVFQGPSLLPPLDVVENVALPLIIEGVPEKDAHRRAHQALRELDIDDLGGKLPEDISGGQAQRAAVARVLAMRPRLILADEPTGQLDHDSAQHLVDALTAAADRLGAALVIATHDDSVIGRMTTRWAVHDGTVTVLADRGRAEPVR
jgi:ABC-type lipoprotein export system ATPase subunit